MTWPRNCKSVRPCAFLFFPLLHASDSGSQEPILVMVPIFKSYRARSKKDSIFKVPPLQILSGSSWHTKTKRHDQKKTTRWAREPKRQTRHTQADILPRPFDTYQPCPLTWIGPFLSAKQVGTAKHQAFSCVDGLLLLGPSTAKLTHFITQNTSFQALAPDKTIPAAFYIKAFLHRPLHPIHNLFLPTARKAQK